MKSCPLCFLIWLMLFNLGSAHPFHTSTAEMEFNSTTGRFEVALKIPAVDFEHMVRAGADLGKSLNTTHDEGPNKTTKDEKKQLAKHATLYLDKQFSVTVAGRPCRLEWVGTEDEQTSKWIYFELVLPPDQTSGGEVKLTNRVLCDLNSNQINTVVFISKAARVSVKTHEQNTVVTLPRLHD